VKHEYYQAAQRVYFTAPQVEYVFGSSTFPSFSVIFWSTKHAVVECLSLLPSAEIDDRTDDPQSCIRHFGKRFGKNATSKIDHPGFRRNVAIGNKYRETIGIHPGTKPLRL
jgi:hypothetical protein